MSRVLTCRPFRNPKAIAAVVAAVAGFATAAVFGVAFARSFTLRVAKGASVTNQAGSTTTEAIVVNAHSFAVYELTGDSSRHPKCKRSNGCFSFWPPVTVTSTRKLSKAPGIRGRLGVWRRDGFSQVTLAGHPLYRYAGDAQRRHATGQGIHTFGGMWHVVKVMVSSAQGTSPSTTTTTSTTTTMTTTTSTTCLYPPYC
jgi:predicted lipoprotein with Yx(FWY)xxD motif